MASTGTGDTWKKASEAARAAAPATSRFARQHATSSTRDTMASCRRMMRDEEDEDCE